MSRPAESETDMSLEVQLSTGRLSLKLLSKDLNQISQIGMKIENGDATFIAYFKAMYPRAEPLLTQYLIQFGELCRVAITNGAAPLFPTDDDYKARTDVTSIYYNIVKNYQSLRTELPPATGSNPSILSESFSHRAKLPKINLPHFNGNLVDWPKFKEIYVSVLHDQTEIPNVEKFHYLLGLLEGDPLTHISVYPITGDNYLLAWNALLQRYDNKRLLATAYVDKLLEFAPLKGAPNLIALQSYMRNVIENIMALKVLNLPDVADFLWLTLALKKLDPGSRARFETQVVAEEIPTFQKLENFVRDSCRAMTFSTGSQGTSSTSSTHSTGKMFSGKPSVLAAVISKPQVLPKQRNIASTSIRQCACDKHHLLYQCSAFQSLPVSKRYDLLSSLRLCFNCFSADHRVSGCTSMKRCQSCGAKHHSLLHRDPNKNSFQLPGPAWSSDSQATQVTNSDSDLAHTISSAASTPGHIGNVIGSNPVILGTAEACVLDMNGTPHPIRLVLDCGSQYSLITAQCARRLGLSWKAVKHTIWGAGHTPLNNVKGQLSCRVISQRDHNKGFQVEPLVMNTITTELPSTPLSPTAWTQFPEEQLADPRFWDPRPIDFLLGNDAFVAALDSGLPVRVEGNVGAIPTIFGLVILGAQSTTTEASGECLHLVDAPAPLTDAMMSLFWETEEVSIPIQSSPEDEECERHFSATHTRTPTGRYMVELPFKQSSKELANNKVTASKRFLALERRFARQPKVKESYVAFMQEYCQLAHMSLATQPTQYLMPHQPVWKSSDHSDKIRVVFDASSKSEGASSLNEYLHVGPKLQLEVCDIILNFRRYPIAVTTDLIKMYRQILVFPAHRAYQHILWREDSLLPLQTLELNTVTYGTACAPYLAMRVLRQLVADEGHNFPLASRAILNAMYVDDLVTGASTVEEALELKDQLIHLLAKGGFTTHKWASNAEEFLASFSENIATDSLPLSPNNTDAVSKVLGMSWNPRTDMFSYTIQPVPKVVTKRSILSTIARLFDPIGFVTPVTFYAKTLLQHLWVQKLSWDETPDENLVQRWLAFVSKLPSLEDIRISRPIPFTECVSRQLIGFCDASQKGFAAVLYVRTVDYCGVVTVSLLRARSRLAPLKTLSVPRLELCAAVLLVKLLQTVHSFCLDLQISEVLLFTDSAVLLAWLKLSPHLLKTFVANRISTILSFTTVDQWHHVPSYWNPADVASRGVLPDQLQHHPLWWHATPWLNQDPFRIPEEEQNCVDPPELKSERSVLLTTDGHTSDEVHVPQLDQHYWLNWMSNYSEYRPMIRALAYVLRFIKNVKSPKLDRSIQWLQPVEIESALTVCIRATQQNAFVKDFCYTRKIPISQRFLSLAVFCDESDILRVGGRLRHSTLPYGKKHPVILLGTSHLVRLITDDFHIIYYHLGVKGLQSMLQHFWILGAKRALKACVSRCLTCRKLKLVSSQPIMGDLPAQRVTPSRPFSIVGVDFAGPFSLKLSSRRNSPIGKAYLCLFVCLSVKALHLEIVSSLTTDAFLAALDRFISRRGVPSTIFSDCGTNFIGAARRLKEFYNFWYDPSTQYTLGTSGANKGITWHFNPPHAPHFGGLWEAAVKSAKYHLVRVVGEQAMLFEEYATFFARVEAILNSRPLCPLDSQDLQGLDYLSPGHFLIGAPLCSIPEPDLTEEPINRLNRWQLLKATLQHFWKRWHCEYLHTLQQRPKWTKTTNPINEGDLVALRDPSTNPLQWKMGRVIAVHPGSDSVTRVATVRTNAGTFKRPVVKLSPLLSPTCS